MTRAGRSPSHRSRDTAAAQLERFIEKFESEHRTIIRAVRRTLRRRLPTANELVYDNYNFFVIGYSSTERPSDAIMSITAAANGIGLCFLHGARLPDPTRILLGSGKQTRFIRLPSAAALARPEVEALVTAAIDASNPPFAARGRGQLVIRSVAAHQRPRRRSPAG